jgi:hypothetical protein
MPVLVSLQAFRPASSFVSWDTDVATQSGTFHTRDRWAQFHIIWGFFIFNIVRYSLMKKKQSWAWRCIAISIVTNCNLDFEYVKSSKTWKGFKVDGILDFSLVGIINDITKPLKDNGISVFVLSTFNTDYIFVKEEYFNKTKDIFKSTDNIRIKEE